MDVSEESTQLHISSDHDTQDWTGVVCIMTEGYTDNLEELLIKHSSSTVTIYGVHRSYSCNKQSSKVPLWNTT